MASIWSAFGTRSDSSQREALREQCAFRGDLLIGICAALRPEKAHGDVLLALSRLRGTRNIGQSADCGWTGPERSAIEQKIAD